MSYILDALKKSEQQRAALNIPVEAPALARQPKSGMPRVRLSLVILLVLLTTGWFIARMQEADNHPPAPVISKQMPPRQVTSRQAVPEQTVITKQATSKQATSGQTAFVPIAAPAATLRRPLPGEIEKRSHPDSKIAAKQARQNKASPEQSDISANTPSGHAPASPTEAKVVPIFKPITPASPVSRSTETFLDIRNDTSQAAPANTDISSLSDLPVSVQESLPSINIEGHIYDDHPAKRMVIINGNIHREKQAIGNGLRLEEITPDGVILSYQGNVFHMGVFDR